MTRVIHWFRRDLRLHDNTALAAAARASGGAVVPVFVLDEQLTDPHGRFTGAARVRFLLESLHALNGALHQHGSALVFRRGTPRTELVRLARENDVSAVYWNRDYSPYATARDNALAEALAAAGCAAHQFKDAVIFESGEIMTKGGTPYNVYTPYARQWHQRMTAALPEPAALPPLQLTADDLPASHALPDLDDLNLHTTQQSIPGGEQHGQDMLHAFTDLRHTYHIGDYHQHRDQMYLPATSRLSAHLRLGTLSPRACLRAALDVQQRQEQASDGVNTWIGELAWRDFYVQILAHFPHVLRGAFKQQYDVLEWENDPQLFAAWCAGHTGYPVVDAAMRQINTEAWMHNRARMIVASFLSKDLLIDWRWGERYFMRQLVDGDPAANNGGWQWAAGTGTDAQPYFRIFNPVTQGQKFDPQGSYVRQYVPELADVPEKYIHQPWKMPASVQENCGVRIGQNYPAPMVDHADRRRRALELYRAIK